MAWPTYLVLPYNVRFLGLFWTPPPTYPNTGRHKWTFPIVFRFICRMTFEKLSKMSRSSIWNRIFIVFIVSGFVIFKFVIYVPTSSFQNIITNVVTNISQSNSMEEIESTSENFMRVSLWSRSFGFWNYLPNNWAYLTFLAILD